MVDFVVGLHHFAEHGLPRAVGHGDEAGVGGFASVLLEEPPGGGLVHEGEPLDAHHIAERGSLLDILPVGQAAFELAGDILAAAG